MPRGDRRSADAFRPPASMRPAAARAAIVIAEGRQPRPGLLFLRSTGRRSRTGAPIFAHCSHFGSCRRNAATRASSASVSSGAAARPPGAACSRRPRPGLCWAYRRRSASSSRSAASASQGAVRSPAHRDAPGSGGLGASRSIAWNAPRALATFPSTIRRHRQVPATQPSAAPRRTNRRQCRRRRRPTVPQFAGLLLGLAAAVLRTRIQRGLHFVGVTEALLDSGEFAAQRTVRCVPVPGIAQQLVPSTREGTAPVRAAVIEAITASCFWPVK